MKITSYFLLIFSVFIGSITYSQSNNSADDLLKEADSLLKIDIDQSISIAKKVLRQSDDNAINYLKAATIIESAYLKKEEKDSAYIYTNKGLEKAIEVHDTISSINFIYRRGSNYYYVNDYKNALSDLKQAILYYESIGDSAKKVKFSPIEYADILSRIASVYSRMGKFDLAMTNQYKAYNIKVNNKASKKSLVTTKMDLGSKYLDLRDYKESKKWLNEALHDATEINDTRSIATCYINLGIVYHNLGDLTKATDSYKKSIELNKEIKRYKAQGIASINLAGLYGMQKKYDLSEHYFLMALNLYKKINIEESYIYSGLGELYLLKKEYTKSIEYNKKALELAKKSDVKYVQLDALLGLSEANNAIGKNKMALDYLKKHIVVKDTLLNQDKQEVIQNLKTKFETEQKEKEIEYLKELNDSENQKAQAIQSKQRYIIIAIALALALLLVTLFAFINKKKKEKRLMLIKIENQELINKKHELDLEHKTKQLTTHALNMMQKNKMLSDIKDQVKTMAKNNQNCSQCELKTITKTISQGQRADKDWDLFKKYFESVNNEFYDKLKNINPDLTANDYRLAALVSLNLNIKETAALLSISPNSVKIARHRLRKKLSIKTSEDLYTFISNI